MAGVSRLEPNRDMEWRETGNPSVSWRSVVADKNPFEALHMFKFDPEDFKKLFDPSKMFAGFETPKMPEMHLKEVMESNRKNFEAMVEANKSAAAAYQDLLKKQMEVFGEMTEAAKEHAAIFDDTAGPEAMSKKAAAYGEAVEKALGLMRKLADNAREANEQAYSTMKDQVSEAISEMTKNMPQPKK